MLRNFMKQEIRLVSAKSNLLHSNSGFWKNVIFHFPFIFLLISYDFLSFPVIFLSFPLIFALFSCFSFSCQGLGYSTILLIYTALFHLRNITYTLKTNPQFLIREEISRLKKKQFLITPFHRIATLVGIQQNHSKETSQLVS